MKQVPCEGDDDDDEALCDQVSESVRKLYYCFPSMFPLLHCELVLAEENQRLGILADGLQLAGLSQPKFGIMRGLPGKLPAF